MDKKKNFPGNLFRRQPINLAKLGFKRARDDPSEAYLETRQANVYVSECEICLRAGRVGELHFWVGALQI